ncbi:ABC-ATPase domain-containing protein [Thermosulfurimonas marina]|uniref:ABC-ATPase domain-containing protein n=1 Tax=Thermosulfurimonas marina TaxID=2047767 RepID=A0A6H1WT95_9BACT|nr:ABC-ATPase domain-containing protein [Thermosulfurimonas marina]QJA06437.1 ABC-ATPase domain-containing protein [Thermosulfurimonas marina]
MERLKKILLRIDGRGYGAYRELLGRYRFPGFELVVDKVQADPFAPPSRVRVQVPAEVARFPEASYSNFSRRVGLENYLADRLSRLARKLSERRGSGKSGLIQVHGPGQEILPRTAVTVGPGGEVTARIFVGLPAAGRRVLARQAWELLGEDLPYLVRQGLLFENLDRDELWRFVETNEDADFLRARLSEWRLVAFVAEGAILPRASGVDPRPAREAVPFAPPPELTLEVELPNRGPVRGLGLPEGVTLIVGGGFHGKSTLLRALELGVYNHRPGDGRELVVSRYETVKIRAEDGRAVTGVDISPFINNLPFGKDTREFETPCASGSTSQAANIMEALEVGARVLLLDEDTSATNFMIRDARMQALVSKEKEPITPFLDRVRELYERWGVSTVLVMGGSGDYLEVADTVIAMDHYRPQEVTARAREIVAAYPSRRRPEAPEPLKEIPRRRVLADGLRPPLKLKVQAVEGLVLGQERLDLSAVEQLVSADQVRTLGLILAAMHDRWPGSLAEAVAEAERRLLEEGFGWLAEERGDLAFVRRFELAAALNRLRTLKARPER